jgi:hypothetical protein
MPIGGWQWQRWSKRRRGKRVLVGQPRAPPLPLESNRYTTRRNIFQDLLGFREGETMQIFPPLVGLFEKREEKREVRELGLPRPKFKFEFEFLNYA